jgi:hypothetical protein
VEYLRLFDICAPEGKVIGKWDSQRGFHLLRQWQHAQASTPDALAKNPDHAALTAHGQAGIEMGNGLAAGRIGIAIEQHIHPSLVRSDIGLMAYRPIGPFFTKELIAAKYRYCLALGHCTPFEIQRGLDHHSGAQGAVGTMPGQYFCSKRRQIVQHRSGSSWVALSTMHSVADHAARLFSS